MFHIPNEKAVWLACAIDCEGHIVISRSGKWVGLEVAVSNTNLDFIRMFAVLTNAHINSELPKKLSKQIIYRARLRSRKDIENVLSQTIPYMIVKREKAKEMLDFVRTHPFNRSEFMKIQSKGYPRDAQGRFNFNS